MSSNTETFVKWTDEDFCDRDTCYFCKTKNNGDWDESCEDAVCVECSDKWEYLDDYRGEGYYRICYDCGACDKCKEWNTDEEEEETESCKTCMAVSGGKIEGCDDCGLLLWKGGGWVKDTEDDGTGFGTQYHDGTGFADCDEDNTGWRKCKDEPNKNKWCSECVYLDTSADLN